MESKILIYFTKTWKKILNKTVLFPFGAFVFSHFNNKRIGCTFTYLVSTVFLLQTAMKYFVVLFVNLD